MVKDKKTKGIQGRARPDSTDVDVVNLAERLNAAFDSLCDGLLAAAQAEAIRRKRGERLRGS